MLMEMQRHQVNGTALEKSIGQRRDRTADARPFQGVNKLCLQLTRTFNAHPLNIIPSRI
jgi:hypothetical protein